MHRNIFLSLFFATFMVAGPASASAQPVDVAIDCATEEAPQRQQVRNDGQTPRSAAASEKCIAQKTDTYADVWMLGMLMLGGLIIGVPAVRRRTVRIVFS